MKSIMADIANWATRNGPFVLTFMCLTGTMVLAVFKDSDVNTLLPTILGIYMAQKGSQAVSAHLAASRDPNCSTAEIIRDLEGLPQHTQESDHLTPKA